MLVSLASLAIYLQNMKKYTEPKVNKDVGYNLPYKFSKIYIIGHCTCANRYVVTYNILGTFTTLYIVISCPGLGRAT